MRFQIRSSSLKSCASVGAALALAGMAIQANAQDRGFSSMQMQGVEQVTVDVAHQDVVPIAEESRDPWLQDPFSGAIADGYIWGRGVLDDKNQIHALLEAAERRIKEGFHGVNERIRVDEYGRSIAFFYPTFGNLVDL